MADKKIIAVVGSTGSQGGGLVRAILADPGGGFGARAITRDTSKDKAKALAAAGAEVVSADIDNVDSLKKLSTFMLDKLQWLEKPVNVDGMVDQSFLPR